MMVADKHVLTNKMERLFEGHGKKPALNPATEEVLRRCWLHAMSSAVSAVRSIYTSLEWGENYDHSVTFKP